MNPAVGRRGVPPPWISWALSGVITLVWLAAVLLTGFGGRVAGHWESSLTMVFGSFLAGSSPEGGGAVAFPVFTKALEVPPPVARTFGLSIQAVGMTMASISIVVFRRAVHWRAVAVATAAAIGGFGLSVALFGQPELAFWPPSISGAWVKATFSIVLATTSILMVRRLRSEADAHLDGSEEPVQWGPRFDLVIALTAGLGGLLSSLTGTGANIVLFLLLVVVARVPAKVALPSAIMVMAAVSVVGFALFALVDQQLAVEVVGDRVVAAGGIPVDLTVGQGDLLGLWLAAVPVVVWGAPLGSLAASLVPESLLIRFVALLATVEVATTVLLVPELRSEPALIAYLIGGLVVLPALFVAGERNRTRLLQLDPGAAPQLGTPATGTGS